MWLKQPILRRIIHDIAYLLALLIVLLATVLSVARLLSPVLTAHKAQIAAFASTSLGQPVKISQVELVWHHFEPVLRLTQVDLLDPKNQKAVMKLAQLDLGLNLWRTAWHRKWELGLVGIQGAEVYLQRSTPQSLAIYGQGLLYTLPLNGHTDTSPTPFIEDLFSIDNIYLKKIRLQYESQIDPKAAMVNPSIKTLFLDEIKIHNKLHQHLFSGQIRLEQKPLSTHFNIAGDFNGPSDFYTNLNGRLYLNVGHLSLHEALQLLEQTPFFQVSTPETLQLIQSWQGTLYSQLWLSFHQDALTQVTGKVQTLRLLYSPYQTAHFINTHDALRKPVTHHRIRAIPAKFSTVFQWKLGEDQHWSILFSPFILNFDYQGGGLDSQLKFSGQHLDLNAIQAQAVPIAPFFTILTKVFALQLPQRLKTIAELKPSGEITHFIWQEDQANPAKPFEMGGYFQNLAWQAQNNIPGVKNLNGFFLVTPHEGQIQVQGYQANFEAPKWYNHPLNLHFFILRSIWQPNLQGKIEFNSQIGIWPTAKSFIFASWRQPLSWPAPLELQAQVQGINKDSLLNLLPNNYISRGLWKWLQSAIIQGNIVNAKILYFGWPQQFPFIHHNGIFQAYAQINHLTLHYSPDWPDVKNFNGMLNIHQQTLNIQGQQATIENAPLQNLVAEISPLWGSATPILKISSTLNASLEKGLNFVNTHYKKLHLQQAFKNFYLNGPMQLFLQLIIPLDNIPGNSKVMGKIVTPKGEFLWPTWQVQCNNIQGTVNFNQHLFNSQTIQGVCNQVPVNAAFYGDAFHSVQHIALAGTTPVSQIFQQWPQLKHWSDLFNIQGHFPFQIDFQISQQHDPLRISFASNLQGMEIKAPQPLGKQREEILPLTGNMDFVTDHLTTIQLKYGPRFTLASMLEKQASGKISIPKLALHFGKQAVDLPKADGLWVTGTITTSHLMKLFSQWKKQIVENKMAPNAILPDLKQVNVYFPNLLLNQWVLGSTQVQYKPQPNGWFLQFNGTQLDGTVNYNKMLNQLDGYFQQVKLQKNSATMSDNSSILQINHFPALHFVIDTLKINQMNLGQLDLQTTPSENGMFIQSFHLNQPFYSINARGNWQKVNGLESLLNLQAYGQCKILSSCLNAWNLPIYLDGKQAKAMFNIKIPFSATEAQFSKISGEAKVQIKQGRILHLSDNLKNRINLGKILTLLSFDSLPRRLSLNFSDLTKPGFSFERFNSQLLFSENQIMTPHTQFHSVVADIKIQGSYFPKQNQLSAIAAVTPHFTASIPAITAIAAGPLIGVAAYAANQVMSPIFNQLFTHYFSIKGSMIKPKIEKIQGKESIQQGV